MKWRQITCVRVQPKTGTYSDWKEQIAKECNGCCVYCAIFDGDFGGFVAFHVDHFRPKSLKEFEQLINDITNLFYACSVCNRFKSDLWPGEPHAKGETATFLDPSLVDFNQHMRVRATDHQIEGTSVAGKYIVERLFLNRPQLLLARRAHAASVLSAAYVQFFEKTKEDLRKINTVESRQLLSELLDCLLQLVDLEAKLKKTRLYEPADTRRLPKAKKRRSTARHQP